MSTKALKITSAITNPTDGVAVSNIVVSFHGTSTTQDDRGITSNCVVAVARYLSEAKLDDPACIPLSWDLKVIYTLAVSEADWDDNTKSPNDMLYDKLKDALVAEGHTVTILNK